MNIIGTLLEIFQQKLENFYYYFKGLSSEKDILEYNETIN